MRTVCILGLGLGKNKSVQTNGAYNSGYFIM